MNTAVNASNEELYSSDYDSTDFNLDSITKMYKWFPPILIIFVTFWNLVCLPVLVQLSRKSSLYVYLIILCIMDVVYIKNQSTRILAKRYIKQTILTGG